MPTRKAILKYAQRLVGTVALMYGGVASAVLGLGFFIDQKDLPWGAGFFAVGMVLLGWSLARLIGYGHEEIDPHSCVPTEEEIAKTY